MRAWDKDGLPKGNIQKKPGEDNLQYENSSAFDKASYDADGGDLWISADRLKLIETLTHENPGLWAQCEQESRTIYGSVHLPFVAWLYKKRNGSLK